MNFEAESEATPLAPEQDAELKAIALARAPAELAAIDTAETEEDLFYALPRAALAAFHLEQYTYAKELAEKALTLAPAYEGNWNFGNAIHSAHSVLGLLALRKDEVSEAISELEKAGATTGSPQLDTFGPTMQLAKALLRYGEVEAVLTYLQQCRSFWKMGSVWLDLWEQKVRAGGIPNCFMHGYR
jgi:tetratricopeptide (TPR) repeat protein